MSVQNTWSQAYPLYNTLCVHVSACVCTPLQVCITFNFWYVSISHSLLVCITFYFWYDFITYHWYKLREVCNTYYSVCKPYFRFNSVVAIYGTVSFYGIVCKMLANELPWQMVIMKTKVLNEMLWLHIWRHIAQWATVCR